MRSSSRSVLSNAESGCCESRSRDAHVRVRLLDYAKGRQVAQPAHTTSSVVIRVSSTRLGSAGAISP
jgi:hypothetical protein